MGSVYRQRLTRKDGTIYINPIYWATYSVNGVRIRRSTKTDKKRVAERQLNHWEGQRDADAKKDRATLNELAQDYLDEYEVNKRKSIEQAEDHVNRLLKTWSGRRAVTITVAEIRRFIREMQAEGYANATINRHLAALKRMLNLGIQGEKTTRRPYIPMLKENNVRQGFMGDLEQLALTEHMPLWLAVLCETAYTYGWRKKELLGLQRPQVDLEAGNIHLHTGTTKNDEGREVHLTENLRERFKRLDDETKALEKKTGRTISHVFHRNGRPVKDFRTAWANACAKAKIGHRLFHDYRRSAVRNMERARVPRSVAMNVTGHKTESVYRRYAIVDQEMMNDATRRIEQRAAQAVTLHERSEGPTTNNGQTSAVHAFGDTRN